MLEKEIYIELLKEYEQMAYKAKQKLNLKKEILYKACPQIEEIDKEISMVGIKITKAIIGAIKEEKEAYIEKIKTISLNLQNERKRLMEENGFSENFFTEVYECKYCKDTGFINNKECTCFKNKLIFKAYNMSNLAEIIKTDNFKTFNYDYYSKEINEENKMSPYENIKIVMAKLNIFVDKFDERFKNFIFYGNSGIGKTFLCSCIAKELLDKGKTVVYMTAFDLFESIKKKFAKNYEDILKKDYKEFKNDADLLIIDDLGTEFITNFTLTEFFNIINTRILKKKPTIISTNLNPEKLLEQYSARVVSRFYGEYEIIKLFGEDIRIKKKARIV